MKNPLRSLAGLLLPASLVAQAPADPAPSRAASDYGILLMAHGGSPEWNAMVQAAVAPLAPHRPIAVAFGMADPATMAAALDTLRQAGVERVAVVRLFISGESFLPATLFHLGLSTDAPALPAMRHGPAGHGAHTAAAPTAPIPHGLQVATHRDGLMDGPEITAVMAARARSARRAPGAESVILIAHGMGEESENRALLAAMTRTADAVRGLGFGAVQIATLREDWPEARAAAETRIRSWVEAELAAGREVIAVPYRVSGFGPYARVLDGLSYRATDGLLPDPGVAAWIDRMARETACAEGWVRSGCSGTAAAVTGGSGEPGPVGGGGPQSGQP